MYAVLPILLLLVNANSAQNLKRKVIVPSPCHPFAQAANGDRVYVLYEGKLASNGKVFDSNLESGKPIDFELGSGIVIKGWDEGLLGTCVGEKLKLEIPSDLAYGEKGAGNGIIPPNADLIFEIELVDLDKELVIKTTKEGDCSKDQKTRRRDRIDVNYVGSVAEPDGSLRVYDEHYKNTPLSFTLGSVGIVGYDKGFAGACLKESRTIIVPPKLGYGKKGIEGLVAPNSTLVWEATILKIEDRVLSFLDRISSGTFG